MFIDVDGGVSILKSLFHRGRSLAKLTLSHFLHRLSDSCKLRRSFGKLLVASSYIIGPQQPPAAPSPPPAERSPPRLWEI